MPNPKVLDALVELYRAYRGMDNQPRSNSEKTLAFLKWAGQRVVGQSTDEEINANCLRIKNLFKPPESQEKLGFDDWIEVIYNLGEEAKQAQGNKTYIGSMLEEESLFCEIAHAIRNHIVLELKQHYPNAFNNHINQLQTDLKYLNQQILKLQSEYKDNSLITPDRNKLLIKLSYLEQPICIARAIDLNLFSYLKPLNGKKENMRYCLQGDFCKSLYEDLFWTRMVHRSFPEFIERAKNGEYQKGINFPDADSRPLPSPIAMRKSNSSNGLGIFDSTPPLRELPPEPNSPRLFNADEPEEIETQTETEPDRRSLNPNPFTTY